MLRFLLGQTLSNGNIARVYVLGDPAYYKRFGFVPETGIQPPYPLPAQWRDAWQSINLSGSKERIQGKLILPRLWLRPELWAPP